MTLNVPRVEVGSISGKHAEVDNKAHLLQPEDRTLMPRAREGMTAMEGGWLRCSWVRGMTCNRLAQQGNDWLSISSMLVERNLNMPDTKSNKCLRR